ncbi:MAG: hypothetical protein K8R88_14550, partial [Armatimonadetes bacterium]|nr:hypothetical protein [Armatimonadota bacterium]
GGQPSHRGLSWTISLNILDAKIMKCKVVAMNDTSIVSKRAMLFHLLFLFMALNTSIFSKDVGPEKSESSNRVISPAGGEQWSAGSWHRILWEASDRAKNVHIEYSKDSGKTWNPIASNIRHEYPPSSASHSQHLSQYLWQIPEELTSCARVRISVQGEGGLHGDSPSDFTISPSQAEGGYKWEEVAAHAAFAPRDGAGALVFKKKMWLLGGWSPKDTVNFPKICNNEVWSSEDGRTWNLEKPNTFTLKGYNQETDWEGRHTAGYAVFKDRMWIVGGDVNQKHYHNDVWSSADGKKWECMTRNVPWGPRGLHYTVAFKGRLWVMGGQTMPHFAPSEERFYDDVWSSADGVEWRQEHVVRPAWPQRGLIGGSVIFKDKIWILGGGTYDTPEFPDRKYYNDVWCSADGIHWECRNAEAPWHPRQYHEIAVFDDKIWVLEGYNNVNRKDVWYSSDGVNWYELPNTPWAPRHAASVFSYDNALWMVAGNNMESDVWKLTKK